MPAAASVSTGGSPRRKRGSTKRVRMVKRRSHLNVCGPHNFICHMCHDLILTCGGNRGRAYDVTSAILRGSISMRAPLNMADIITS